VGKYSDSSCLLAFLLGKECFLSTDTIFQILLHVCYKLAMRLTQGEEQFVQQIIRRKGPSCTVPHVWKPQTLYLYERNHIWSFRV